MPWWAGVCCLISFDAGGVGPLNVDSTRAVASGGGRQHEALFAAGFEYIAPVCVLTPCAAPFGFKAKARSVPLCKKLALLL